MSRIGKLPIQVPSGVEVPIQMATVRAGDDEVEMLALDRDAFAGLLKESPEEAQDIAAVMSARLASLQGSA